MFLVNLVTFSQLLTSCSFEWKGEYDGEASDGRLKALPTEKNHERKSIPGPRIKT